MRQLLQTKESRQLEIIEYFLKNPGTLSQDELCNKFNLSIITLQKYFQEIKRELPYITINESNHHYSITIDDRYGLTSVYNYYIQHNISFKILFTLFFNPTYNMEDLSEKLGYSETSLYRSIKIINSVFKENHFDIYIIPTTAEMDGDEKHIRSFYSNLLFEAYSMFDWPFNSLNKSDVSDFAVNILSPINMHKDLSAIHKMMIMFAVNLIRIQHGFNMKRDTEADYTNLKDIYNNHIKLFNDLWSTISERPMSLDIAYNILFPLFDDRLAYSYSEFSERTRDNDFICQSFFHLQKSIDVVNRTLDLENVQQFYLILNLHNNSCIQFSAPGSLPIFQTPTENTMRIVQTWAPEFYQVVHQEMTDYLQAVHGIKNEFLTQHLIFIYLTFVETYVENFFENLKKIRVLILNDQGIAIANQLKSEIETIFSSQLVIDTWKYTSSERILQSNYDIILTNFSIPKLKDTYIIQTPVILLPEQFTRLLECIDLVSMRHTREIEVDHRRKGYIFNT